jgi:uncharacterized membrane protein YdjX (TVP38/TMEM64 family)
MPTENRTNVSPPDDQRQGRAAMTNHSFLRLVALFLIIGVATFLFFHFNLHTFFLDRKKAVAFIESFGSGPLSTLIFIVLQIAQVLVAPLPGEVTGIIGGYLYGPVMGTLYSTIGLTIGSWVAFLLARVLGLPFVEKVVSRNILQKYDYFMEHRGALVTFVMFLIPGFPKDALCYVMGLSHMRTRLFLVVSTAGRLFGTIMLSVGGSCVRNDQMPALYAIIGITAVILILAFFYREKLLKALSKKQQPKE